MRTTGSAPSVTSSSTSAFGAGIELRVGEERLELGRLLERGGELGELVARDVDGALVLRGLVERARVHAVRDGHGASGSAPRARRSRGPRPPRRRAASGRPRRAPCRRRARSPRGSGRRPRRGSGRSRASSPPRSACSCPRAAAAARSRPPASRARSARRRPCAPRRGCSADSERACARIARCCSSSSRASLRALSASSTAWRIRSRRSSIVFWIGPNAYLRRTKNAIPKQISVQIMRPGTTSIRPLPPSSAVLGRLCEQIPASAQMRTKASRPPIRP